MRAEATMADSIGSRILLGVAVLMVHVPTARSEPWPGWFPTAGFRPAVTV
jgi:hypothetical protein